ncbi:GYDIA family GHMP kinase [Winogradskyella sp.]|uniref:GYDIA family GHMP kinase n=1 Tax=Winogradskyella sp. TaxID=1883156 RepID=UPI00261579B2|nr:GYDIA family GHMP kinase [Winogradskyella sp.]
MHSITKNSPKVYRSNGKLLITGEYAVLDGALALAIPTKYGQSLTVEENDSDTIIWKSFDKNGEIWFDDALIIEDGGIQKHTSTTLRQAQCGTLSTKVQNDSSITDRLIQILKAAKELNPEFLNSTQGYTVTTHLDFNRKWGLGTSSTLINNVANWAKVDAYRLLAKTFGGSGYDIACAQNNSPITYQRINPQKRIIKEVSFNPVFKSHLYFVYLNQKQNSRDGIKTYKALGKLDASTINKINQLTASIMASSSLADFEDLIIEHESLISNLIQQRPIKSKLFSDFNGAIKSLGAWGGDFVLVTSCTDPTTYFKSKGFETIIPYAEMALN